MDALVVDAKLFSAGDEFCADKQGEASSFLLVVCQKQTRQKGE